MNIDFNTVLFIFMKVLWIECVFSWHDEYEDIPDIDHNKHVYTNKWVVHITDGEDAARALAKEHNFIFHGQLGSLQDYYHLEHGSVSKRSRRSADVHHSLLSNHPAVKWSEQQKVKKRTRRGYFSDPLYNQQWYIKND